MRTQCEAQISGIRNYAAENRFPGAVVTGISMVAGPLVLIAATLVDMNVYRAAGAGYVHAMGAHRAATALTFNLVVAGLMFLMFAVIGLAGRVTVKCPSLGRWGGVLTVLGLLGPMFFNGVYFAGFQLAGSAHESAAGFMIDHAQIIPSNVINIAGPALVAGFILLAVGAKRAGVLNRLSAWALGITCIIPAGFISGFLIIATIGFLGTAVALVPLGIRILGERAS